MIELYQLTKSDYQIQILKELERLNFEAQRKSYGVWRHTPDSFITKREKLTHESQYATRHRIAIKKALKAGIKIPDEVLKDYPDLANVRQNLKG